MPQSTTSAFASDRTSGELTVSVRAGFLGWTLLAFSWSRWRHLGAAAGAPLLCNGLPAACQAASRSYQVRERVARVRGVELVEGPAWRCSARSVRAVRTVWLAGLVTVELLQRVRLIRARRAHSALASRWPPPSAFTTLCGTRPDNYVVVAETPRSGNRLAHVAWVTRICVDHLRRGDVYLCDKLQRLCWKCHKLHPVTEFEVSAQRAPVAVPYYV